MITQSLWELMQIVRVMVLVCFLPVLLYRIRRVVRYPTSIPAIAVTAFGVSVWFWMLLFTDWVWAVMPPYMHAVSIGGWATVWMAACLQIFVIGISGDASQVWIRRGLRVTLVVTGLVLVVVAIAVSRSRMLAASADIRTLTNVLLDGGDRGATFAALVSNGFLVLVLLQLAWVGLRHADRSPVGVGLGLLAAAALLQLVAITMGGVLRPLSGGAQIGGDYGPLLQILPGCVGAVLMVVGFSWPPVVLRIQARRNERRLRPLHDEFVRLFPQLFPPMESRICLSDRVFERGAHIQDGLTLLAQSNQVPLQTDALVPQDESGRALAVANWVVGQSVSEFSSEWLHAPVGLSDEVWVLAIADAYRHRVETWVGPEEKVCVSR
ncbi:MULTISPECIES: hypothetical protein [Mycobacteroides]|uniref:hypothetical protein n=1 Tax=Mycobacteroides TaxID=670516 RepID=UPI0008A90986|nr:MULTISPECIES: hypothetical protein [Mycobacteroides]OHU39129.1 hypothetical protein BKG79_12295 [Mycobacteroides chelonae]